MRRYQPGKETDSNGIRPAKVSNWSLSARQTVLSFLFDEEQYVFDVHHVVGAYLYFRTEKYEYRFWAGENIIQWWTGSGWEAIEENEKKTKQISISEGLCQSNNLNHLFTVM